MSDGDGDPVDAVTRHVEQLDTEPVPEGEASSSVETAPKQDTEQVPETEVKPEGDGASTGDPEQEPTGVSSTASGDGFSIKGRLERLLEPTEHSPEDFEDDALAKSITDTLASWSNRDAVEEARLGERVALNVSTVSSREPGETWEPLVELIVGVAKWVWLLITSPQGENNGGDAADGDATPGGNGGQDRDIGLPDGGAAP